MNRQPNERERNSQGQFESSRNRDDSARGGSSRIDRDDSDDGRGSSGQSDDEGRGRRGDSRDHAKAAHQRGR